MPDSVVDELLGRLTGVDHETIGELHRLGTGSTELARDNHFTALGTRLHDEAEDTVACTADGKTAKKLVAKGLALCNGRETAILNLLGIELQGVFWELEALLDESSEFTDAAALFTENFLGVRSANDNLNLN